MAGMALQVYSGGHRGYGRTDNAFAQERNSRTHRTLPTENTLEALMGALRTGFVETDAVVTSDDEVVLTHSNDVRQHVRVAQPLPHGKTYVDEMTLAEAQSVRLGPTGADRMPSLRDLLRAVMREYPTGGMRPFTINLELKGVQDTPRSSRKSVAEAVLKVIRQEHFPLDWIRFSSYSVDMLADLARRQPDARLGMLFDPPTDEGGNAGRPMFTDTGETKLAFTPQSIAEVLKRLPSLEALHPEIRTLTPQTAALAGRHGLALATWANFEQSPLTDATFARAARDAVAMASKGGVSELSVITDYPDEMQGWLQNEMRGWPSARRLVAAG